MGLKILSKTLPGLAAGLLLLAEPALARVSFSPYISIKSTKSVRPDKKNKTAENETIKQRQEYGINFGLSFWRLFIFQLGVGQSKLTTTEKTQYAADEYDEIDYEKDLNMSTDNPDNEIKITETQNVARASLVIDPSFSIFIMRLKLGVTARQRLLESQVAGEEEVNLTEGPTYKPHSGLGLGVRLSPRMYFMAEYSAYHYKFPEIEPFERELSVTYSVSL